MVPAKPALKLTEVFPSINAVLSIVMFGTGPDEMVVIVKLLANADWLISTGPKLFMITLPLEEITGIKTPPLGAVVLKGPIVPVPLLIDKAGVVINPDTAALPLPLTTKFNA